VTEYRLLGREEIALIAGIDRTQSIDHIYYMRDDVLVCKSEHWDVPEWSPEGKASRVRELEEIYDGGATFHGAFDGERLVGVSVLNHNALASSLDRLELAGLWVSHGYRRQGIGQRLVHRVIEQARARGARSLYVSATPSKSTVDFYMSLGMRLADPIDPGLYEEEPEDIHLELGFGKE